MEFPAFAFSCFAAYTSPISRAPSRTWFKSPFIFTISSWKIRQLSSWHRSDIRSEFSVKMVECKLWPCISHLISRAVKCNYTQNTQIFFQYMALNVWKWKCSIGQISQCLKFNMIDFKKKVMIMFMINIGRGESWGVMRLVYILQSGFTEEWKLTVLYWGLVSSAQVKTKN